MNERPQDLENATRSVDCNQHHAPDLGCQARAPPRGRWLDRFSGVAAGGTRARACGGNIVSDRLMSRERLAPPSQTAVEHVTSGDRPAVERGQRTPLAPHYYDQDEHDNQ